MRERDKSHTSLWVFTCRIPWYLYKMPWKSDHWRGFSNK